MSYIGKQPGFGIRHRYLYTATASQTTFSGADDNGQTLAYADSKYLDVYLNGVLLVAGTDYTATTLTSVTLTSGASASDIVEIVAYDIFSVADTVSSANGGTFNSSVTFDSGLKTDTISEETSATGVTIDGVLLKDNDIEATDGTFSGGIYLGGTGAANYLDDYEEGNWTPTLGGTATYTVQDGKYVKVGGLVYIVCRIHVDTIGTGSTNRIQGLPFTSEVEGAISSENLNNLNVTTSFITFRTAGTDIYAFYATTATWTSLAGNPNYLTSGTQVELGGCYKTTA